MTMSFQTIEELNGQRGKHHWDQTKGTATLQSRIKYLPAIQQSRLTERRMRAFYTRVGAETSLIHKVLVI